MGTQLVLTVGTNPLPVWVAWHHLKDILKRPVKLRLVHTSGTGAGTEPERDRLQTKCTGAVFLHPLKTSAGNPQTVREDIGRVLLEPLDSTTLHVHYTGGTKVMGVETVSAIEAAQPSVTLETSYLDARGGSGPTIVSRATTLVDDTRRGIDPDLGLIAYLNGFEIGPFRHTFWKGGGRRTQNCPAPGAPTETQLEAADTMLEVVRNKDEQTFRSIFSNRDSRWNSIFTDKYGDFACPKDPDHFGLPVDAGSVWQTTLLPKLNDAYPYCQWNTGARTLRYPQDDLEQMHSFFNGRWFEYAAYAALLKALKKIDNEHTDRSNYKVFQNVYVRRQGNDNRTKPFELDVVAILGYQIVVVSCTFAFSQATLKQKGMEAILRARQLGGDEARAIVLCAASDKVTTYVQEELHDEIGSAAPPLKIWGKTDRGNLRNTQALADKFETYLKDDMKWS